MHRLWIKHFLKKISKKRWEKKRCNDNKIDQLKRIEHKWKAAHMLNYDHQWSECLNCGRYEHFKIIVVQKDDKYFYITRCPKCKAYDEVKIITLKEVQSLRLIPQKGKII